MMRYFILVLSALAPAAAQEWIPLFDGKTLGEWKPTGFYQAGKPTVAGGVLELPPGGPMTGVTWAGRFPKAGYEMRWEGIRRRGNDFFCALTVPVGDSFGTLVTGGWGGDIVGFSSINGWDAAENETRSYVNFENERWYRFRLLVTTERVAAWIDDESVFDVKIAGRDISLRPGEIEKSAPLGFAAYRTHGAVRKIEYRLLRN
jgi:hypothetical protein